MDGPPAAARGAHGGARAIYVGFYLHRRQHERRCERATGEPGTVPERAVLGAAAQAAVHLAAPAAAMGGGNVSPGAVCVRDLHSRQP